MALYKHTYKTKTGVVDSSDWYFRFNRDGKTYVGTTGYSNKTQAARFEEKRKREVDELIRNGDTKSLTIHEALMMYLDSCAQRGELINIKSRVRKLLGVTTDTRTQELVEIYGFDGTRKFESLTDADVQQLVMHRRASGLANGTILTELTCLSQTIILVRKLGYLVPNIAFDEIKKDNAITPSKGRLRFLSKEEEAALLVQLDPNTEHKRKADFTLLTQRQDAYDLATCLLDLGGRYSEITNLKWSDIDLTKGTIALWRNKVQNESTLGMTKRAKAVLQRRFDDKRDDQVHVWEAKEIGRAHV